jgi:ribosomal RNA-processing protein 8
MFQEGKGKKNKGGKNKGEKSRDHGIKKKMHSGPKPNGGKPNQQGSKKSSANNQQKPAGQKPKAGGLSQLSSLQEQFKRKLEGARFRSINEELYSTSSESAFQDFQQNPEKFDIYHRGYREQAAVWPVNPLDGIINWIRRSYRTAVVADMGCGDARLSETLTQSDKFTVHSFDLVSVNPRVTACNIAHTPLESEMVDVAVFCLSLMGVDCHDFIREAHRILKPGGVVKIVEVRSRFEGNHNQERFRDYLQACGFEIRAMDTMGENKMFFDVECVKVGECPKVRPLFALKACQYKKR